MSTTANFSKMLGSVSETLQQGRHRLELLRREREELIAAPAAIEDLVARAAAAVEAKAALYPSQIARALADTRRQPLAEEPDRAHRMFIAGAAEDGSTRLAQLEVMLCYLMRDQVKAAMADALSEAFSGLGHGMPLEQRKSRLVELDGEIGQLEGQLADLARQVRSIGI